MSVEVLIFRHAIATDRGVGWEDAERPLTVKGIARLERSVAGLARLGVSLDALYSSPWTRAVETAERLAGLLDRGEPQQTEALARTPNEGILRVLRTGERIGLVGHEPWMGELCAWLCIGEREQGSAFPMKKAGAALLRGEPVPGGMELVALLPPKVLRIVGG